MQFLRSALLLFSVVLLFSSCDNTLDINDEWTETPVVYGLLNPNSSVNYIRLQRAFLGEGNAYLMGQNPDSIYYDTNLVSLRLFRYKNDFLIDTIKLSPVTTIEKEEGVFVDAPHFMYGCFKRLINDSKYRLLVTRQRAIAPQNTTSAPLIFNSATGHQSGFILRQADLEQYGITAGMNLHSIGLVISKLNSTGLYPVSLYINSVTDNCINTSAIPDRGIMMFNGNLQLSGGWNDIYFKTPYAYTGGNLMISICSGSASSTDEILVSSTPGCISTADIDVCGGTTASASYEQRPLVRFGYSGNGVDFIMTESTTPLVSNLNVPYLSSTSANVNLANAQPYTILAKTSRNGYVYGLIVRFRYLERKIGAPFYAEKSVDYKLPVQTSLSVLGGEDLTFKIQPENFFAYLANQIKIDPSVERPASAVLLDFDFRIGTREFYTYYIVNQPNNAIFSIPDFTTMSKGKGILTSRVDTIRPNFSLSSASIDSLQFGTYTSGRFN